MSGSFFQSRELLALMGSRVRPWHVNCDAVQASFINSKEKSMPMHHIKSGVGGIFCGLVSTALLLNSLTVHPQEKESKPSASQTKERSSGASQAKLNQADERMMKQLAQSHLSGIALGKLAQEKAQSNEVKSFGKKMLDDDTKAHDELKQLAQSKGVSLPAEADPQQQSLEKKLAALSPDKFDRQYMQHESTHALKDTHRLLERISSKAEDADLKSYAGKIISTVESHQQLANDTRKNLRSTSEGKSGMGKSEASGASGEPGAAGGAGKPGEAYDSGTPGGPSGGARTPRQ
jgi:putative membrane protein